MLRRFIVDVIKADILYWIYYRIYGQRNILDGNIKRGRIPEYIVCSFSPPEMMTLEIKLEVKQNNKFNLQIFCIK